ncbi:nucleoside-diphosphate-sugar epimerase [Diaporthe amygdali]|uniref:nucleoside-diphosphate-sugar epimerase n=1 Tax=Phomopsis amygdali TaxID=1214568 RepID=UPI0022FE208E|nr:nucleoside-diphosphate-sugar epimerase [Diaporthe amygdali]KAJ0120089.1 nucleoside-diphosphate-sugar epimerase [Diaporthe amygdali]
MKLAIGGSSGFVGAELVRQALSNPAITSVVGLSRRETSAPSSAANAAKLKLIVCEDFENYSDGIKRELEDVDACIWTIAVTPMRLKSLPWEETVKISKVYPMTAIQTLANLPRKDGQPLRFVYMSGHFAPRQRTEQVKVLGDYGMTELGYLRGEVETDILEFAEQSKGAVQSCITKSGFIKGPGKVVPEVPGLPLVELQDITAAILDQVINGFEKDTLSNDDLVRIGQKALKEQQSV